MEIFLQLRSKTPIYEQIITQVKQQIVSGAIKDGDSVTVTAVDGRIEIIKS